MKTVDDVIDAVQAELITEVGRGRVAEIDAIVRALLDRRTDFGLARGQVRARPGTSWAINTTLGRRREAGLSLRVRGVECALVTLPRRGAAVLRVSGNGFRRVAVSEGLRDGMRWKAPEVARYVASCVAAGERFADREAHVQELLLREMAGAGVKYCDAVRDYQPVRFAGVPIQIPVPVRPRGRSGSQRTAKGHVDVLARRQRGALRVFELKAPGASEQDVAAALDQAVAYAASIDHLMARDQQRPMYWQFFGSRRGEHQPMLGAVAFVADTPANERSLDKRRNELILRNARGYSLAVMLYRVRDGKLAIRTM